MTHVQFSNSPGDPERFKIVVDGVDLSMAVLRRGFRIETTEDDFAPPSVTMIVGADVLEVDLPEAVIVALREQEESDEEASA